MEDIMSESAGINRRKFLKNTALGMMGAGIVGTGSSLKAEEHPQPGMPKIRGYRTLGRTGFKASDIGLGGVSNVEVIKAMLNAGVTYIDTAETYDRGKSEIAIGQAIKGRDRKSLFITTKLHLKPEESKESILDRARKCLERLDSDYIDCLMNHNPGTVEIAKSESFHQACAQLKSEGKIRFVGISNHGNRHGGEQEPMEKVLLAAARDGRFAVMLLVHNFLKPEIGESILKVCQQKGIGATLMKTNPVGMYLSMKSRMETMMKESAQDSERVKRMRSYMDKLKKTAEESEGFIKKYHLTNPAEIRIASTRFGLTNPAVTSVLARTATFEDVDQFLQASGTTLSNLEAEKLSAYRKGPGQFYCRHACGLCEPYCPHHLPVNTIMRYNHYFEAQGNEKHAMKKYATLPTSKADLCESCRGDCQSHCPYGVPIQALLTMAHQNLSLHMA
jgi:predicted aldo/keto reductase-like oxidoreductase